MSKKVTPVSVEIVREAPSLAANIGAIVGAAIVGPGLTALLAWWFFAAWFPHLGLTWWQLVLPVFVVRGLFGRSRIRFWRDVEKGNLLR